MVKNQNNPRPTPAAAASAAALTQDTLATQLESLLSAFTAQYQAMLASTQAHRDAIRRADNRAMQAAVAAQQTSVAALGILEQRRRELVALACGRFPTLAQKRSVAVTLTDLCQCVSDADRPRLLTLAAALKQLIQSVGDETKTIKAATASLLAHMEGLMRQVGRQLSHAGTYSAKGFVEPGGVVVSALDLST